MFIKINKGSGFRGLLNYLVYDSKNKQNPDRGTVIGGNLDGATPRILAAGYSSFRRLRPTLKKPVAHFSISLPPIERKLSNEEFSAIAENFMQRMEFKDCPYSVIRHEDTEHQHIHIVASRINCRGETITDKQDFQRAKNIARQLEEEFNLTPLQQEPKEKIMQQTQNQQPIEAIHCADNDLTDKKRRDYKRRILEQHYQFDIGSVLLDDLLYVKRIHNFLVITTTTKGTITDKGDEITSKNLAPEDSAKKIIALAKMKGWLAITLTGSDPFLEAAMLEAIRNGIEVIPTNENQRKLLEEAKRKHQLELEALARNENMIAADIGLKIHKFRENRNTEDPKQVIIKTPRIGR
jgi:hypothetical protein